METPTALTLDPWLKPSLRSFWNLWTWNWFVGNLYFEPFLETVYLEPFTVKPFTWNFRENLCWNFHLRLFQHIILQPFTLTSYFRLEPLLYGTSICNLHQEVLNLSHIFIRNLQPRPFSWNFYLEPSTETFYIQTFFWNFLLFEHLSATFSWNLSGTFDWNLLHRTLIWNLWPLTGNSC